MRSFYIAIVACLCIANGAFGEVQEYEAYPFSPFISPSLFGVLATVLLLGGFFLAATFFL